MKHVCIKQALDSIDFLENLLKKKSEFQLKTIQDFKNISSYLQLFEAWRSVEMAIIPNFKPVESVPVKDETCNQLSIIDGFVSHYKADKDFHMSILSPNECSDEISTGLTRSVYSYINSLLCQNVLLIEIPENCDAGHIQLPIICSGNFEFSYPRVLIKLAKSAKAVLSLTHEQNQVNNHSFTNVFIDIVLDEKATLQCDCIDASLSTGLIETIQIKQAKESVFNFNSLSYSNRFVRRDIQVAVNGLNCVTEVAGIALLQDSQVLSQCVNLDHYFPNCQGKQIFKSILSDKSFLDSSGLVTIYPKAHNCVSTQSNPNLLLSDSARVVSRPQLRIEADDVDCGHGSTIGQLNEEEILYFLSRGISRQDAFKYLLKGFVMDVINRFDKKNQKSSLVECMLDILGTYNGQ